MLEAEKLGVATPERVALELPVAGIGYRSLAYLVDAGAIFTFWIVLYFASSLLANLWEEFKALSAVGRSIALFAIFFAQWCYWTICEIALNGQTLGKRLLRIRVVKLDGSPVAPLDSALRNLLRFVDFLPFGYCAGIITMLFSKDNRRIGDLVAGTALIRDERVDLSRYTGAAAEPHASVSDQQLLLDFLHREAQLLPEARSRLATRFAQRYSGGLSPEDRAAVTANADAAVRYLRELTTASAP